MSHARKTAAVASVTVVICLLATGCKSSSKASGTAATAAASAPAATAAATAAVSAAVSVPAAATASAPAAASTAAGAASAATKITCSQLTTAQVQPLVAQPITNVAVTVVGQTGQRCAWATSDTSDAMVVTVDSGSEGTTNYQSDVQGFGSGAATSVPGVGDQATRGKGAGDPEMITTTKGGLYCSVDPGEDEVPGVAALEHAAGDSSDIGDAAYAAITAAVGTLCNRIYGSGNTTPDLSPLTTSAALAAASAGATQDALPTNFSLPPVPSS